MHAFLNASVLIGALLVSSGPNAATWMATAGSVGVPGFTFGGATFSDGVYNIETNLAATTEKVLIGAVYPNGVPNSSLNFIDLRGLDTLTQAPQVDIGNLRADFSSLYFTGWLENGTGAVGWDLGLNGWVPLLANGDGSYTSSWISPDPRNGQRFGGQFISFTFTSAIAEPATALMFGLTLPLLALQLKRRGP